MDAWDADDLTGMLAAVGRPVGDRAARPDARPRQCYGPEGAIDGPLSGWALR